MIIPILRGTSSSAWASSLPGTWPLRLRRHFTRHAFSLCRRRRSSSYYGNRGMGMRVDRVVRWTSQALKLLFAAILSHQLLVVITPGKWSAAALSTGRVCSGWMLPVARELSVSFPSQGRVIWIILHYIFIKCEEESGFFWVEILIRSKRKTWAARWRSKLGGFFFHKKLFWIGASCIFEYGNLLWNINGYHLKGPYV